MKKCPACNSSRYDFVNSAFRCQRCGFVNKSSELIDEEYSDSLVE